MSTSDDPRDGRTDDPFEGRLRTALTAEAATVHPAGDGLARIREGIDARRGRAWWRNPAVALVAAAAVGLAAGGAGLALTGGDEDGTLPATPTSPEPSESDAPSESPPTSAPPSATETGSSTPAPAQDVSVYVYYLHDDGSGPRLYREQHSAPQVREGKVATAVTEMFGDRAADPDYSSAWPAGTKVLDYARSGDTATVDLSDFPSAGGETEDRSVQQLVYTVTANDTSVKRVRLLVDGETPPSGHADWSAPVARAPLLDVQGWIWILEPRQGRGYGSPVDVTVYGTAFEGNVILKVFEGKQEVAADFVTTAMGEFREASTAFQLGSGTYTVRAYDENAENGELIERDSKTFTVR